MHGFDYSIPQFFTRVRGIRIVVTPDLISEVLHIPRVAHLDYPGYNRPRTVSKDELSSLFCEIPSSQGERQNTPCSGFAKGPRFLNMVMTFILHPLSHYNTITKPRARFLLSLLKDISIDFPSHFILSFIDVYRDTATCDKLIFPSAITRIIHHFSVPRPVSNHFFVIGAIDVATIRQSEAQLRPRQTQIEMAAPPASSAPSTSTPSSSTDGVTLDSIIAELVYTDTRLDTLSDKLRQVNTCVGCITQRHSLVTIHLSLFICYCSPDTIHYTVHSEFCLFKGGCPLSLSQVFLVILLRELPFKTILLLASLSNFL